MNSIEFLFQFDLQPIVRLTIGHESPPCPMRVRYFTRLKVVNSSDMQVSSRWFPSSLAKGAADKDSYMYVSACQGFDSC